MHSLYSTGIMSSTPGRFTSAFTAGRRNCMGRKNGRNRECRRLFHVGFLYSGARWCADMDGLLKGICWLGGCFSVSRKYSTEGSVCGGCYSITIVRCDYLFLCLWEDSVKGTKVCYGPLPGEITETKLSEGQNSGKKTNWKSPFRTLSAITTSIWNLPKPIQRICNVQFFAWIGWFPFLFYSTTWVAEIYDQTALQNPPDDSSDAIGQATRAGSFAFLVYSLVSLSASFVLPLIVSPSYEQEGSPQRSTRRPMIRFRIKGRTYAFDLSRYLRISFLTLPRAWTASHIIFCLAMMSTIFVSDVTGASVVIGICGISWSLTMWAPFSLLGEYISETESKAQDSDSGFDAENRLGMHPMAMASKVSLAAGGAGLGTEGGLYHLVEQQDDSEAQEIDGQIELQRRKSSDSRRVLFALEEYKDEAAPTDRSAPATSSHDTEQGATDSRDDDLRRVSEHVEDNHMISKNANPAPSAGVLLGIHNMYVVLPQFLVTFFSSVIFHFLEKGSSTEEEASPDAIGVVLRFGAIMAGIAGYLSTRIGRSSWSPL